MSIFTQIRDAVTAPVRSSIKFDPILNKVTTGHFSLSVSAYKDRVAAGVHELYSSDPLAQKLGIKESSVTKVAIIAGYVVAAYFTYGLAAKAMGGSTATTTATTTTTTSTAEQALTAIQAADALNKANEAKKAKAAADAQAQADAAAALAAEQRAQAVQKANASAPLTSLNTGVILAALAAGAALLM